MIKWTLHILVWSFVRNTSGVWSYWSLCAQCFVSLILWKRTGSPAPWRQYQLDSSEPGFLSAWWLMFVNLSSERRQQPSLFYCTAMQKLVFVDVPLGSAASDLRLLISGSMVSDGRKSNIWGTDLSFTHRNTQTCGGAESAFMLLKHSSSSALQGLQAFEPEPERTVSSGLVSVDRDSSRVSLRKTLETKARSSSSSSMKTKQEPSDPNTWINTGEFPHRYRYWSRSAGPDLLVQDSGSGSAVRFRFSCQLQDNGSGWPS